VEGDNFEVKTEYAEWGSGSDSVVAMKGMGTLAWLSLVWDEVEGTGREEEEEEVPGESAAKGYC